ncbi:electron transport complex protein RnfB [Candidatus Kinetoplastibacterium oncopeltii TCC290E]|uniref:Electron transport complex protein RnfB n=1 Tax=Candidatus Kinetoplastidibacterium stringomonadis TCC290E TaxID=1208920 RepID=M1LWM1_9PROT|nr:RnfABCDGE type electron transport complex subunit B [Candidatus Kinetoplastibacterium oncopeltii]AGF48466.1 electron transport complex protein RnfB [Candidatus Kinetoplastibacterium oncopeltii TCC290E]
MSTKELISIIDDSLPQTQCRKCGYADCMSYANAIVNKKANINLCNPGGNTVSKEISYKLKLKKIDENPDEKFEKLMVAYIEESECIGCTLCIKSCPVSAIIGSNKLMHSIVQDWCTGCELCLSVCPVDCIKMKSSGRTWNKEDAKIARERYEDTKKRTYDKSINKHSLMSDNYRNTKENDIDFHELDKKKLLIERILNKARNMRTE